MNWILSIPCLFVLFAFYRLLGEFVIEKTGYQNKSVSLKLIAGFLIVHFLGFLVGFPSQYFQVSWTFFFVALSIVYLTIIVLLIRYYKDKIKGWGNEWKQNWHAKLKEHFKNNWFIYLIVIVFTLFSMSNQMAYYVGNYDDAYYIGKVINQVGAPVLSVENYINGGLLSSGSDSILRVVNSYEIIYGYFASLFHISIPFFCRGTMVIHNYILMFMLYRSLAELFVSKKNAQYTLVVFGIFLFSNGYLTEGWVNLPLKFRIFDAWQMQTAIFYGGSVVRTMAIPVLLLFGKDLIRKFEIKKFLFIIIFSISFLSFSTIYVQQALLLGYLFVVIKCIAIFIDHYKTNRKYTIISAIVFSCLIIGLFLTVILSNLSIFSSESAKYTSENYLHYHDYLFKNDITLAIGFIIMIGMLFITKDKIKRLLLLIVFGLYLLVFNDIFVNLMTVTSFNFFFVSLRTVASLQYILLVFIAVIAIYLFEKVHIPKFQLIIPIGATCSLAILIGFVFTHLEQMGSYDYAGSGLDKNGYSAKRLFSNQYMVPELVVEIGDYFNSLPYGNYYFVTESTVPYEDTTIDKRVFNMASNRIEVCYEGGCNYFRPSETELMDNYYSGELTYDDIKDTLEYFKIDYMLVEGEEKKNELEAAGKEAILIYEDNGDIYYLIKLREHK